VAYCWFGFAALAWRRPGLVSEIGHCGLIFGLGLLHWRVDGMGGFAFIGKFRRFLFCGGGEPG